jgi:transposase InsO family protein
VSVVNIAVTDRPTARSTTNAAKGLLMKLDDIGATIKFVIRDRGGQYAPDLFDHVLTSNDVRVILTPLRSPKANAICERVIGTLRRECTDHFLILGPTHLHRVLGGYVDHYNRHRPHRTLQEPPCGRPEDHPVRDPRAGPIDISRRQVLGGLINEYRAAA